MQQESVDLENLERSNILKLSQQLHEPSAKPRSLELLEFFLGNERYAIESIYIKEVYPLKEVTPLPCVPAFVHGIMNVRRKILSVIDLKKFLGLDDNSPATYTKMIILEWEGMEFAILTDKIIGMKTLANEDLQTCLSTLSAVNQDFFKAVTPDRLVILDGKALLKDKKMIVQESVEG